MPLTESKRLEYLKSSSYLTKKSTAAVTPTRSSKWDCFRRCFIIYELNESIYNFVPVRYLLALLDYLESFLLRVKPLHDVNKVCKFKFCLQILVLVETIPKTLS